MRPGDPGFGEAPPGAWRPADPLERGRYEDFYAGVRDWVRGDAPPPVDPGRRVACSRSSKPHGAPQNSAP